MKEATVASHTEVNTQFCLSVIYSRNKKYIYITHSCSFSSQVSLSPPGLARKRMWNKKYPICIILAHGEAEEESLHEGQEEEERIERHTVLDHQLPVTLYLFGRTGREKEEWFQHILSASRAGAKGSVSGEENSGKRKV